MLHTYEIQKPNPPTDEGGEWQIYSDAIMYESSVTKLTRTSIVVTYNSKIWEVQTKELVGDKITPQIAEFNAVVHALRWAHERIEHSTPIKVTTDSSYVYESLVERNQKPTTALSYAACMHYLQFRPNGGVTFTRVPRSHKFISLADYAGIISLNDDAPMLRWYTVQQLNQLVTGTQQVMSRGSH